ncbi:MAG: hydantoinase/carbamoylase family amidase [Gemmatimonadetes bacterium]|nr:M20 family metallo-hydrolase [Gemmatimonadota bacterium]NIR78781.1 M20 family metallo-hydrolase [Gemmatimonadota bacterium]NIT87418.1 M20 family metallo-hydrolase [Gemmatimonadota bacterium]NIU31270.1 M20 family metallo-hydrolase [Gemmatimonadota bacterium]NIU35980.1 hydantoinase/carbamoylase family amidase [Gemmatimonadota bacterium]
MDRRGFIRTLSALGATSALAPAAVVAETMPHGVADGTRTAGPPELTVDGARLNDSLEELRRFGGTPDGGTHRVAFSDDDLQARRWLREILEGAGMETRVDTAANLLARRPGRRSDLPPLLTGSHVDTVPRGGSYDGHVGVMAAVEVARTLHDAGVRTRHPLEVVVWANEEGGKTGSRAWAGEVEPSELELSTASGRTIGEGLSFLGGDPDRLDAVLKESGDLSAYFELHVEQGAVLDRREIEIGVVEGIVGIKRWTVTVTGFANHAGTTPMDQRRDALVAAARFVDAIHRTARNRPGRQVATVGRIEALPGAPNVIPGEARLSLEIRDLKMETIDSLFESLQEEAGRIGEETETEFSFERFYLSRAAPTDSRLRDLVEASARELGLSALRMPSGAGHDAQSVALFAPVGMIFVPSEAGISHSPREHTLPEDVTNGANVLLRSLLSADETDWV